MKSGTLEAGDIFVLCTDGLTAHVENWEILPLPATTRRSQACDLLVAQPSIERHRQRHGAGGAIRRDGVGAQATGARQRRDLGLGESINDSPTR